MVGCMTVLLAGRALYEPDGDDRLLATARCCSSAAGG